MNKRKATMLEMKGNAFIYGNHLHSAFSEIPAYPPDDFLEKDLLVMKSYALSIVSKLRFFLTDIKFEQIKKRPDMRDRRLRPE